jgi:hypothetical protein
LVDTENDGQASSLTLREWKLCKGEIWRKEEDANYEEGESTSSHFEFGMIYRPDMCERNI